MAKGQLVRIDRLVSPAQDLDAAIDGFLHYCRAKNLSQNTLIYYGYRLGAFRTFLRETIGCTAPGDVTAQMVRQFVAQETSSNSPSTANHSITTLKSFFNYLVEDGFLDASPMTAVRKVKSRTRILETFSIEQIEKLLKTCGRDFVGVRDRAIVLVLFDCGLRATELCELALTDVDWTEQTLLVLGKGDKERLVPFGQAARQALNQYIARRGQLDTGSLFVTVYGEPLDRRRLHAIIKTRCATAGITGTRCSPHIFRHTFAVTYLRAGGDVFSLQKLLGHSDLTMTRRYAELSQTDVREKHRQFSPADGLKIARPREGRMRIR